MCLMDLGEGMMALSSTASVDVCMIALGTYGIDANRNLTKRFRDV